MKREVGSNDPLALEALDEYLSSDASPDECMQLSDLDGFLTGIVVGPELIKPSEWLPVIWSGDPPEFENDETAELILGTIMGRYNEIVHSLAADPPEFDPILWQTNDGFVIAGDWAEGFMDAISLRPIEWGDMLDDEETGLPLFPIIALAGKVETGSVPDGEADGQNQLLTEAADLIPSCVIAIDAFWKARRESASDTGSTLH